MAGHGGKLARPNHPIFLSLSLPPSNIHGPGCYICTLLIGRGAIACFCHEGPSLNVKLSKERLQSSATFNPTWKLYELGKQKQELWKANLLAASSRSEFELKRPVKAVYVCDNRRRCNRERHQPHTKRAGRMSVYFVWWGNGRGGSGQAGNRQCHPGPPLHPSQGRPRQAPVSRDEHLPPNYTAQVACVVSGFLLGSLYIQDTNIHVHTLLFLLQHVD